ncbi:PAB-dependent poly(A)-specific ribonuclease subunit 3 [Dinochytrium kinnereticum]|nr:PAB-dependent poly(A)-specific ribonuclease subunit 3 [Dinochytrium kinnereticum]
MIGPRLLNEINSVYSYRDLLETELSRETENGRLTRLLIKLNLVNERPEYETDEAWSESGQFYPLKLFRNFIFHQMDEAGNPILDMGYVLQCLNKVDTGVDEKIALTSPDNNCCFIVSFLEIKQQADQAFQRLRKQDMSK